MGENPFDKFLPSARISQPEAPAQPCERKGLEAPPLEAAKARIRAQVLDCEERRHVHQRAWEKHKQDHHAMRYERALEHEQLEDIFIPTLMREKREREDDDRFHTLTDFDQLLELRTDEEYLRGRRAWERRHRVEDVRLEVKVVSGLPNMTGFDLWRGGLGIFFLLVWLAAMVADIRGIALAPILALAWVLLARLPLIYNGTFDSSGGARGASGNAV